MNLDNAIATFHYSRRDEVQLRSNIQDVLLDIVEGYGIDMPEQEARQVCMAIRDASSRILDSEALGFENPRANLEKYNATH